MDLSRFIELGEKLRLLTLIISQNGEVVARHQWDEDCRRNVYSASKSFTSAAVGIAMREGLLSIEEKLTDAFAEDLPQNVSDNLAQATVRDLLTMQLGQAGAALMGAQRPFYADRDWVKKSLAIPFADAPGTRFVYNNVGPYLAGVLVQRRAGCDLTSYLMPRLFGPLSIQRPMWEFDPQGYTFGSGGLFLCAQELHRLGLLYLQDGQWNGRQIVPAEWVAESSRKQAENGSYGYGYLFWLGEQGSFRADGKYCQLSIVLKEKNAVITVTAECRDGAALNRAIFDELYPQL